MNTPANRNEFGSWLNMMQLTGEGAEIGVAYGGFSRLILDTWSGRMLHMIDPWERQDASVYKESTNDADFEGWHREALAVARHYKRALLWKGLSIEVAPSFKEKSLDFVYIDGNHSFEAATSDLDAWWPKVKRGGIVGGHDFQDKTDDGWYCQVASAVTEWTAKRKLQFVVTPCSSFWIPKL